MPSCPRCRKPYPEGTQVCQECGAPLAGGAEIPLAERQAVSSRLLPLAVVLLTAGIAAWVYLQGSLPFAGVSRTRATPAEPPVPGPPPPAAAAPLPEQVQALFNTLREAQLKKDLALLMSCYSPGFPGLAAKRQQVQKAWEEYSFTNMFYFLDEVTPLGPDQARVRVTWELQAQPRGGGETLTATQVFQVELRREQGAWKIAALQELPGP